MELKKKNTERLAFKVPTGVKNQVCEMAKKENATTSELLRFAVNNLINNK